MHCHASCPTKSKQPGTTRNALTLHVLQCCAAGPAGRWPSASRPPAAKASATGVKLRPRPSAGRPRPARDTGISYRDHACHSLNS